MPAWLKHWWRMHQAFKVTVRHHGRKVVVNRNTGDDYVDALIIALWSICDEEEGVLPLDTFTGRYIHCRLMSQSRRHALWHALKGYAYDKETSS